MANNTKNTNKKMRLNPLRSSMTLFLISTLLYLASSLFIHQYNNMLASKKQDFDRQIADVMKQNDAIRVELEGLASIDRINEIAAADNISHIQENIITINDGDAAEGE